MKRMMAVLSMAMLLPAIALAQRPDRGGDRTSRGQNDHTWNGDRGHNNRFDRGRQDDRRYDRDDRRYDRDDRRYDRDGRGYYQRDVRYELARPYAYGRFARVGPRFVFRIDAGGPVRFHVDGGWFAVAAFDQDYARNWFWNTDDIVINDDPDHVGWYLAYNTRLGTSVHVQYMGE